MIIETKYNIGDEVWIMRSNQVETAKVINITIGVSDKGFSMNFAIVCKNGKEMYNMNLRELFPSKQALLDSL